MKVALEIDSLVEYCEKVLNLSQAVLPDEYYYSNVPQCVIDSVFSIGVKYEAVRNTVLRFSDFFQLESKRPTADYPPITEQFSTKQFIRQYEEFGGDYFVEQIFMNKQRTSPRNGILKGEAVYRFCKVLRDFGINYLQDVRNIYGNEEFEKAIKSIPGQKSGISLVYFYMLAGDDEWIKPDRMIVRFLEKALDRKVKLGEAQDLLVNAARNLSVKYPTITPRLLDYQIWEFQRNEK